MTDKQKLNEVNVTGSLARDPEEITTRDGKRLTKLVVMENQRVFDRDQQQWVDGDSNDYEVVIGNERLGAHALTALSKGKRVTVRGPGQITPYVNRQTGEPGLNRSIMARDVSLSMFDERFERGVDARVDSEPRHREIHEQTWKEQGLAERASLSGRGTPPPPGVPEQTASVELGAPTPEQRREVAERQQRAAESWSVAQQQQQMPQQGFSSPSL